MTTVEREYRVILGEHGLHEWLTDEHERSTREPTRR